MTARRTPVIGWPLVGVSAIIVTALAVAAWAAAGGGEAGIRAAIRMTARTSVLLFLPTFSASPLNALRPRPWTKVLLANRRYLGVSVAASMYVHLAAIVSLAVKYPESFWAGTSMVTIIGGGSVFVILALMTATSFDRTTAWLGRRAWKALHTTGMYLLWFIFFTSYAPRAAVAPVYLIPTLALLIPIGLRILAFAQRKLRAARASAP